jgi:hypothetical protein
MQVETDEPEVIERVATLEWVDWHNNRRLHTPATT